jgi:hypothetical protein
MTPKDLALYRAIAILGLAGGAVVAVGSVVLILLGPSMGVSYLNAFVGLLATRIIKKAQR